jgi:phage-related protein
MRACIVRRGAWKVLAVCSERGDCYLRDFLSGLEGTLVRDRDRMLRRLARIAEVGPSRTESWSHKLGGDVWELKAGDIRVLYFQGEGRVVVCSHGLVKHGQKIPRADIDLAQGRARTFREATFARTLEVVDDGEEL